MGGSLLFLLNSLGCGRRRINLEEPVRVASTTRINLEETISSGYPAQTGLTYRNQFLLVTQLNQDIPGGTNFFWLPSPNRINLEEPVRVASTTRINSFLRLSVHP